MQEKENLKESFCPVCIATVPLAFSLAGGKANMLNSDDEEVETLLERRRRKQNQFFFRLIIVASLAVIIYYTFLAPCDACKLKPKK